MTSVLRSLLTRDILQRPLLPLREKSLPSGRDPRVPEERMRGTRYARSHHIQDHPTLCPSPSFKGRPGGGPLQAPEMIAEGRTP